MMTSAASAAAAASNLHHYLSSCHLFVADADADADDDADDDADCRLSRLKEKYDDVAVWSRDELMQLCNAENRSRASPVLLSIALVVATAFKRILTSS